MSCRYCGGDYCGSSLGGPSMCNNTPTYDEVARGLKKNPLKIESKESCNKMKEIFIEQTTGGYEVSEREVSSKNVKDAIVKAAIDKADIQETDSSTVIIEENTFTIFLP